MEITQQFFDDLFKEEKAYFRCMRHTGGKLIDYHGKYDSTLREALERTNEENYEVYFVVNSGGYSNKDITVINAVFVDLDCGKNKNKEYYPLEVVREYKENKLVEIRSFPIKPTYIIETRNGLHCYWLLDDNATAERFKICENLLITHFNADKAVNKMCNLMRVPNTYWCKDSHNKYKISIIERNDVRYNIEEIIRKCPTTLLKVMSPDTVGFGDSDKKKDCTNSFITVPKPTAISQPDITQITPNWLLVQYRKEDILKERLNAVQITLHNHNEFYDFIKKQDLAKYLGVRGGKFSCLFHKDNNPSANIVVSESGHQIYYCHSDKCRLDHKGKNIIQLTELLTNYSRYKALGFLRKVYNVTYHETEWQKERRGILEENQRLLINDDFEECYEEVYKRIKDYLPELYSLNGIAKDFILTEAFTTSNGKPIFYASNNFLSSKFGKDVQAISKHIALFAYLGLLDKLNDSEIPEFLLKRAKNEAAKKNQKQTIQFYSIPSYGELSLAFSKAKAMEYVKKGFTMKGFGRELLLRTLGEEEANRVYPKMEGKQISKKSEKISLEIEQVALKNIKERGWITEKEILAMVRSSNTQIKERHLKAMLPEFLDKYSLVKTRLNKQIKSQINFGGEESSYPYIIHMKELLDSVEMIESIPQIKQIRQVISPKLALSRKEQKLKVVL
ncbi:hypothetical protein J23TS9_05330 [Paenibacillus sp. J23TS9]|uniref:hypothetical protein n=1 Tax=Paenibacillus sp. J23TS9 TaxID=2807193 RepID=UPI001B0DEE2A|nr:hypothetical protein [Paenibacillus sp. J23TS9]GIP25403.1 hypothetical protein J23TS9_05330 [Paenibacillus sp. J23TS9]